LSGEMVLAVCAGPVPEVWTALDMAGTVYVGELAGGIVAQIRHAKSLWDVATLPSREIVTVGEDRIVRVWTTDAERTLPADVIRHAQQLGLQTKQAAQTSKLGKTPMQQLINSLPTDPAQYRGEDASV